MSKVNRCVVRVQPYTRDKVTNMERHNERKNEHYGNGDVDLSRADMNVHFKQCEGTYLQAFDKMLADGVISTKGLKKDGSSKIINEMIFDVNSEYFERMGEETGMGGYDYAKSFFEEAYKMAVKEAGGEQYVLSAVLHADERNSALSEKLGRDVYHYHLHVVFIPVVEKEVKWSTRCKDPALVGTVKETITQVSHSKKWKSPTTTDENGKQKFVYSYSLLQDRYHDHMKQAGFIGFERGERGSTAEHLDVVTFKAKQEAERADREAQRAAQEAERAAKMAALADEKQKTVTALDTAIQGKEDTAAKLDAATKTKRAKYSEWKQKLATADHEFANVITIERMGEKRNLFKNIQLSPEDWKMVSDLAKEGIKAKQTQQQVHDMYSSENTRLNGEVQRLQRKLERYEGKGITDEMKYYQARQRAPQRMAEVVADIMRQPPEQQAQQRTAPQQKRSTDLDR